MQRLETERLVLRPATRDDAPFILGLMNEPAYHANIGDRGVRTEADAVAYLNEAVIFRPGDDALGFSIVELKATGEPVGICGLVHRPPHDEVEVGYAIAEAHGRKGYATEAAAATLAHAVHALGAKRVVAGTSEDNAGSRRVLEAIGMRLETVTSLPGYSKPSALYAWGGSGVGSRSEEASS